MGYRTDLERVVPAVDLVVSCSYREGLPLNIVEAMLCKKAAVASFNRGNAELVEDGVTGYLMEPENAEKYAERIMRLVRIDSSRREMGEAGSRRAQDYVVDSVKQDLMRIITEPKH